MTDTTVTFDKAPIGICIVRRNRRSLDILEENASFVRIVGISGHGIAFEELCESKESKDFAKALKSPTPPTSATLVINRRPVKIMTEIQAETIVLFVMPIDDLQKEIDQAENLAEKKSNFLATMSHEMRTPMQSVFGLLEMIEMEKPPSDILTMVRTAKQSASGLLEILDSVLDFAKMDADQMELDLFEVPVRMLCRGIIEALEVKTQGKDIELIDMVDQDVPYVIVGDPKRLRQILINLTGNALKFTKEGSITIRATLKTQHIAAPKNGIALRIEVVDTGIGMSEEVAARLFQPFAQADNTTSRKYGGTGLGLSISKKLVELMGGKIGVTSKEGEGSVFWFEIPTEAVDINAQVLKLPELDGISVLSVEDHPLGAKEIQKSLRSMGANVEHCGTIGDAIELIKRRPFDVGIFDQGLPDGEGLDLIRQTMDIRPFMGLILYTARDDVGLQHTLSTLGVTYLTKPASRVGLGEAVQDAAAKVHKMEEGDGPRRLVIAEDTASVRDVLRRQLDKLGVEATFVENGVQALEAVRSGKYGILFTDLHMPEMDGYALVEAIREDDKKHGRHFPTIALTADVQMAQRQVYMGYGFDECLLKPVSLGHFKRLLIRWGLLKDTAAIQARGTLALSAANLEKIDRDAIITQMGEFNQDTIEMLKLFIEMTEPLIEEVKRAHAAKDYRAIAEAAHSLKGAARSACAVGLGDLASDLQDRAEAKKNVDALIQPIQDEFIAVKKEIERL